MHYRSSELQLSLGEAWGSHCFYEILVFWGFLGTGASMKEPESYMGGCWGAKKDPKGAAEPPPTQPPLPGDPAAAGGQGKAD